MCHYESVVSWNALIEMAGQTIAYSHAVVFLCIKHRSTSLSFSPKWNAFTPRNGNGLATCFGGFQKFA